jgi:prophage regulatory protein
MTDERNESPLLLRCREVQIRTGLPRSTIYRLIARESFPAPVRLTKRAVGWHKASIDQWINTRISTASI